MSKRVLVGMISHETNCFSPIPTPLAAWKERSFFLGDDILQRHRGRTSNMGAFMEIAEREGWELIPSIAASATPSLPTDAETYAYLKSMLLAPLQDTRVDAVLLGMHGGMMAEGVEDPELDLVTSVRALVGDVPFVVTLDLHSNLQKEMVEQCDAIFGFDTNPHIDSYERALEAAELLSRMFNENVAPVTAFAHPPMMPPTINMRTEEGPMVKLFTEARRYEAQPGVLNVSVFGGFPFVDAAYSGTSIVVTALDKDNAQQIANELADMAWSIRDEFLKDLPDIDTALQLAEQLITDEDKRPVILADVADNAGGGGSADTPELLRAFIARNIPKSAAALLWDPAAVQQAMQVGIGNVAHFSLGAHSTTAYGAPVEVEARVAALTDGKFPAYGPMARGSEMNIGPAARLVIGNVSVLISSIRLACNEADIFRHLGIEPTQQRLLMVKSRGHFRASFQPLAKEIIEVDAPGAANPNLKRYPYKNYHSWPLDI